jgi:DNA-directed RNA polymerase subunit M/transcription elongation factor TFIIS
MSKINWADISDDDYDNEYESSEAEIYEDDEVIDEEINDDVADDQQSSDEEEEEDDAEYVEDAENEDEIIEEEEEEVEGDIDEEDKEGDEEKGIMFIEEEKINIKKKKQEYVLETKKVNFQKSMNKWNEYSDDEFESMIKDHMKKVIPSEKNVDVLYKNSVERCKVGSIVNKNDLLKLIQYILTMIGQKTLKEIQSYIKNDYKNQKTMLFDLDIWDEFKEEIKKDVLKLKTPVEVVEGIYQCSKCKGRLTHSYNVQLRRSDEPPTVFIHCMNKLCMHKWREG